ncbi:MAG: DUF1467 family protein [Alphaproteobacteria bacterium]|jgi:predicted secreted protein|nr:DUF1467 family protein [Alphaproteobacteria bacterium]MDP6517732.1 DUF1467 family protein [Alphaproteobacteria bacterium]
MNVVEIVVVFVIVWWLAFFVTLPFGIHRVENPELGTEPGAPERPRLWLKAGVTTVAAGGITAVAYALAEAGLFSLRAIVAP